MESHEFITSRTKGVHTFLTAWHVEVVPTKAPASWSKSLWYAVLAPFITKVEKWAVQDDMHYEGDTHDWPKLAKSQWPDRCHVVYTRFGTACVIEFKDGAVLQGITVNEGRKAKALTMGTWRKYGKKRGPTTPPSSTTPPACARGR